MRLLPARPLLYGHERPSALHKTERPCVGKQEAINGTKGASDREAHPGPPEAFFQGIEDKAGRKGYQAEEL